MKELLKKLIQTETTIEQGELHAAEIIKDEFSRFGINCRIDSWDQNRANIIAHIESDKRKPAVLFVCHLDVVGPGQAQWKYPPFKAIEENGKIYGRGTADMKGGIATVVTAIHQVVSSGVKLQGDIIFVGAAGEETDSCGIKRFISDRTWLGEVAGVVIPEPTDFSVVTAHRGMIWLNVTTKGKAVHSSTPELGVNAIGSMKAFLDELENYKINFHPHPLLGSCSLSVNTISGGKTMNAVPDQCSIGIDIRTLPGQNHKGIVTDFEKIFAKLKSRNPQFQADISVIREVKALQSDRRCAFVKDFCSAVGASKTEAVGFTTDGSYLASLGAAVVIFGPGQPHLCHKPDEYIKITDLDKALQYYKNIVTQFLA